MAQLKGEAKQEYVAELFARIAGRYDLMNDLMTFGQHRRWKRHTARITAQGLEGMSLDIATGTGDLARALSRQTGIEHSIGLDLLPEMISRGYAKTRSQGLALNTTMMLGDALRLPFPDGSFACATAGFSLRNMPDIKAALSEMVRVVRPGGRITTLELSPMGSGLKSDVFRFCFHRLVPLMGQVVTGNRAAYTYLPQSVDYFLEADRLASIFQELGLEGVGYRRMGIGTVALHWGQRPQ
ncbi:MAG: hypothetical protein BZY75_00105 [SAR202 cluster bacterium Io17-Chloro-G7]|nr:MAG: hypothetical protein BZY75_00105 [SAR202 cluster bacterium Io17-Chloro-G7]